MTPRRPTPPPWVARGITYGEWIREQIAAADAEVNRLFPLETDDTDTGRTDDDDRR